MRRAQSFWLAILPLLLGTAVLDLRHEQTPRPASPQTVTDRSLAVPASPAPAPLAATSTFELDAAASRLRLQIDRVQGHLVAIAQHVTATMTTDEHGEPSVLDLSIDLDQFTDEAGQPLGDELWHLLGVKAGDDLRWHGRADRRTAFAAGGVEQVSWSGSATLGARHWHQRLELWCGWVQTGQVRLLGVGAADASELGLPQRYWLSLLDEHPRLTIGLDLAFRSPVSR